jgi:signal transduction histidine kinase
MSIGGERKFTGILHDLTGRVRMEEQLREQASLVRLGEMAAVIAHEIKNPLAGIRGAVQVIGGRLPSDSREAAVTGEIISRIDTLNALIQDLLLFARPPKPKPTLVDVPSLISTTVDLLIRDTALSDIEIQVEGASPPVVADPELLKIVFQNLIVNGAQAMRGKGRIRVSIGTSDVACEVRFVDAGPGIPPEIRQKIFTPFFTTKARGTGLGLPTARRLVEAHRGTIHVDCPPAGGTTVTIQLPVERAAALTSRGGPVLEGSSIEP